MKSLLQLPRQTQYLIAGGAILATWLITRKKKSSVKLRTFAGPAEGYSALESESGCDPTPKVGVMAFRSFILQNFGGYDAGIVRECGPGLSGHQLGKSWDWGTNRGKIDVNGALNFLFDNNNEALRRAGITYLIWQRRIWNTRAKTWQNYTGTNPHTDHVHFSFGTEGAMGRTSFYRG